MSEGILGNEDYSNLRKERLRALMGYFGFTIEELFIHGLIELTDDADEIIEAVGTLESSGLIALEKVTGRLVVVRPTPSYSYRGRPTENNHE